MFFESDTFEPGSFKQAEVKVEKIPSTFYAFLNIYIWRKAKGKGSARLRQISHFRAFTCLFDGRLLTVIILQTLTNCIIAAILQTFHLRMNVIIEVCRFF